jgi:hypothetical protein
MLLNSLKWCEGNLEDCMWINVNYGHNQYVVVGTWSNFYRYPLSKTKYHPTCDILRIPAKY